MGSLGEAWLGPGAHLGGAPGPSGYRGDGRGDQPVSGLPEAAAVPTQ